MKKTQELLEIDREQIAKHLRRYKIDNEFAELLEDRDFEKLAARVNREAPAAGESWRDNIAILRFETFIYLNIASGKYEEAKSDINGMLLVFPDDPVYLDLLKQANALEGSQTFEIPPTDKEETKKEEVKVEQKEYVKVKDFEEVESSLPSSQRIPFIGFKPLRSDEAPSGVTLPPGSLPKLLPSGSAKPGLPVGVLGFRTTFDRVYPRVPSRENLYSRYYPVLGYIPPSQQPYLNLTVPLRTTCYSNAFYPSGRFSPSYYGYMDEAKMRDAEWQHRRRDLLLLIGLGLISPPRLVLRGEGEEPPAPCE